MGGIPLKAGIQQIWSILMWLFSWIIQLSQKQPFYSFHTNSLWITELDDRLRCYIWDSLSTSFMPDPGGISKEPCPTQTWAVAFTTGSLHTSPEPEWFPSQWGFPSCPEQGGIPSLLSHADQSGPRLPQRWHQKMEMTMPVNPQFLSKPKCCPTGREQPRSAPSEVSHLPWAYQVFQSLDMPALIQIPACT